MTPENLANLLSSLTGDSTEWPSDDRFAEAWHTHHAYHLLNNPKIVYVLKRLSDTFLTGKNEGVSVGGALSVEHILPQAWQSNWPLRDGSKGLTQLELLTSPKDDPRAEATRKRNQIIQTLGNLTILTQSLNSSVSNSFWKEKKPELLKHSLLPINQVLHDVNEWDEVAIQRRSGDLLERALKIWPRSV